MPSSPKILFIHPPLVRPTEPPIGVSAILGFLGARGIQAKAWDANLAGILRLLDFPQADLSPRRGVYPRKAMDGVCVRGLSPRRGVYPRKAMDGVFVSGSSVRTTQAYQARTSILRNMRSGKVFQAFASHFHAVNQLKHLLGVYSGAQDGWTITPTNIEHSVQHPFQASAWQWAAENPEKNPFITALGKELEIILSSFQPTHIGFSMNYLSQVLTTFAFSGFVKKLFPQLVQIVGGSLISAWLTHYPESASFFSPFDRVVPGNAEESLLPILLGNPDTRNATDKQTRGNLFDAQPIYDDFPLLDYLSPGPVLPVSFSRGCYWTKCLFCTEQLEQGNFLMMTPDRSVQILQNLEKKHAPKLFHFGDNAISPALCQALIRNPLKTPWYGFIRFIDRFQDEDFCFALRKAGCIMLQLGLESGHPRVLEEMQKGITPEQAEKALHNLHAAGIGTYVYLLFGSPFEREAEAVETMNFVAKNHDCIDFVNLAIFSLPIQSPESRESIAQSSTNSFFPLHFNYQHPKGWDKAGIRRFLESEFKAHPAIRPIIQRKPLCFTSNHGPFFCMKDRRAFRK